MGGKVRTVGAVQSGSGVGEAQPRQSPAGHSRVSAAREQQQRFALIVPTPDAV